MSRRSFGLAVHPLLNRVVVPPPIDRLSLASGQEIRGREPFGEPDR